MDLTFRTPRLPRPGETLTGHDFQQGFGGKGANQAVMAARLGADVTMVGRVGKDAFGEQTLANLRKEEIDTRHVFVDDKHSSGVASIVVDDNGQNLIIVIPGANGALSAEDIRQAAPAIQAAKMLLCQLEVPLATTLEAFRLARAGGVRTLLNPAPAQTLPEELLHLTDLCVPNESELELLTGQTLTTVEAVKRAGRQLLQRGPSTVIVTLGAEGALVMEHEREQQLPAEAVQAVDTTGAGDAFLGSLAVFLVEGVPLLEAVRRANTVAALSVTRPGAQASFPTYTDIQNFFSRIDRDKG
jgi:ribokinase